MAAAVSVKHLLFLLSLLLFTLPSNSTDFEVGWEVPHQKDQDVYTSWAEDEQFYVGDTILFEYECESLMVVSKKEYLNCASSHPTLLSSGTITFRFDRPGIFFFISGEVSNCNLGQRMAIEVEALTPLPATSSGAVSSYPLPLLVLAMGIVACLVLGSCWF